MGVVDEVCFFGLYYAIPAHGVASFRGEAGRKVIESNRDYLSTRPEQHPRKP